MAITRTSISHPLHIATLHLGDGQGRIGVSFCPGKYQSEAWSGAWTRDLAVDLDAVRSWGAAAVLTLVEAHELTTLRVERLGAEVAARDMQWFHLPIPDVTAPGADFERAWAAESPSLRGLLRGGRAVFVHCKGGLGRAGTIAARLLVELGAALPAEAIAQVRRARPGAIETPAQEAHVHRCRPISHCEQLKAHDPGNDVRDRARGALLGLAVGDALGTTLEFQPRDAGPSLEDIVGGGPFRLEPGVWTDDTSMALALAESLIALDRLDPADLMRRFVAWWRQGAYSPIGHCFDIGTTTRAALARFERTGNAVAGATDEMSAGNGSLMRLAPVAIWGVRSGERATREAARLQSATTHGAPACLDACEAYALMLRAAIFGEEFEAAVAAGSAVRATMAIDPVLMGSWRGKSRHQIASSGYVAHSLEAALWCVHATGSFRDAVLLAANLADDADTTAAITGQLAGALYGAEGIPASWRERVAWGARIEAVADDLLTASPTAR